MKPPIPLTAALLTVSAAAMADPAGRANTADPGSAPLMRDRAASPRNDAPARANTADPNSAPMATDRATTGSGFGKFDPAGRADTSDPGSVNSGATNAAGQPANPMANPEAR
jgi:hypothetical protein